MRVWQLDISASSEGGEDLNVSKALFTGTQVKQMKERADTLFLRLQQLAERPVSGSSTPFFFAMSVVDLPSKMGQHQMF